MLYYYIMGQNGMENKNAPILISKISSPFHWNHDMFLPKHTHIHEIKKKNNNSSISPLVRLDPSLSVGDYLMVRP